MMFEHELALLHACAPIDFIVEAATPESLIVLGYVDDPRPGYTRCRLVFVEPSYIQLAWSFSFRRLEVHPLTALLDTAPAERPWVLPAHSPAPATTPSLSFVSVRDAEAEGQSLFVFLSIDSSPADPSCFVVAKALRVEPHVPISG